MGEMNSNLTGLTAAAHRHRGLLFPAAAAGLIFVILVPMPPALMDMLLVANIALAAVVLLTTIYVSSPLEFSVFPTVLLGATLIRLVLNVATTRLILTAGADGATTAQAQHAAGRVIWSFSSFVASGSLPVGVILFAILVIVQFVVITRGAARVSEVTARFVLDAMPGKQMAIDSDLSAGLIGEQEARGRRSQIARQADFYGAMDGASKFLRGDAIAAIIITLVNILGGLYVGMVQYGWEWSQTVDLFTRLTIGDGLVTQIPAFIVSISAALIVTRSAVRTNLGEEVLAQLLSRPIVLTITALFLGALSLTSLPKMPLLMLGIGCVGLAWMLSSHRRSAEARGPSSAPVDQRHGLQKLLTVEPLGIEVGYALVPLVDPNGQSDVLERISALRRQMASELGIIVPNVRIRDNMRLDSHEYSLIVRGEKVALGQLHPRKILAVAGENVTGRLVGIDTIEPVFSTPAVWINHDQRSHAEQMNYTIVDPLGMLLTHLAEIIRRCAPQLVSREQVVRLLENLRSGAESLVSEVLSKLRVAQIQKVLQALLRERVPIRDLETILEVLDDHADRADDVNVLTEHVRARLRHALTQPHCDGDGKLWCVQLDENLEETIGQYVKDTPGGTVVTAPPELTRTICRLVDDAVAHLRRRGRRPVILCGPPVRPAVRQLLAPALPDVTVMGYNEIGSVDIESVATVGIEQ